MVCRSFWLLAVRRYDVAELLNGSRCLVSSPKSQGGLISQENRYLVRDLIALGRHLEREANAIGKLEAGVGFTDALVLGALRLQLGGRARPSDLVYRLLATRPAVTASLRRLEDAGYVDRETSQEDRREVWISITASGNKAAKRVTNRFDDWADQVVDAVDATERDGLRSMLGRIGI